MDPTLPFFNKKVLILGNWSYKNLGDELILLGTVRLLQSQGNQVIISAYHPEWLQIFFSQFSDLDAISYIHEFPKGIRSALRYFFSSRVKELKRYRKVDGVIIGGGEILTEESVNAYRYRNIGLVPLCGRLQKKGENLKNKVSLYLMGGIQIPQKKKNLSRFRWLLNRTQAIFARDQDSVQGLTDFGYDQASFLMDTSYFAYPWDRVLSSKKMKTALINLNKNGAQFFDQLLDECRNLLDKGYQLRYVPVSKGNSATYNDLMYKNLLDQALGIQLPVLDWETDFAYFIQELANTEIVITARLHLFLISAFVGTQVKVFPYQKKILKMQQEIKTLDLKRGS